MEQEALKLYYLLYCHELRCVRMIISRYIISVPFHLWIFVGSTGDEGWIQNMIAAEERIPQRLEQRQRL